MYWHGWHKIGSMVKWFGSVCTHTIHRSYNNQVDGYTGQASNTAHKLSLWGEHASMLLGHPFCSGGAAYYSGECMKARYPQNFVFCAAF